jgi:hypothetical protein
MFGCCSEFVGFGIQSLYCHVKVQSIVDSVFEMTHYDHNKRATTIVRL